MSDREPRVGDVALADGRPFFRTRDADHFRDDKRVGAESEDRSLFNLFDLLSGDPSAWAEALRFAPPGLVAINEQYPGFPACICAALASEEQE